MGARALPSGAPRHGVGASVQTLLAGHICSVGAAAAGRLRVPVCSRNGDLQQRSCSYVGGKCALLGGGESRCKVLSCAEATLHVGGGALSEDHNK